MNLAIISVPFSNHRSSTLRIISPSQPSDSSKTPTPTWNQYFAILAICITLLGYEFNNLTDRWDTHPNKSIDSVLLENERTLQQERPKKNPTKISPKSLQHLVTKHVFRLKEMLNTTLPVRHTAKNEVLYMSVSSKSPMTKHWRIQ